MNQKVNAFAMKYLELYRNPKTTNIQVEETFADECFALGFEMDSGNSFCEKYPKAFNDVQEFDRIIEETIAELKEAYDAYSARLKEMLR